MGLETPNGKAGRMGTGEVFALETWYQWLARLKGKLGGPGRPPLTNAELGDRLGVHENTIINWAGRGLPEIDYEERLAELDGSPVETIAMMLDAARLQQAKARIVENRLRWNRMRALGRPSMGTVAQTRAVVPSPDRRDAARRITTRRSRKRRAALGAATLWLTTACGMAVAEARPVGHDAPLTPSYRTRRAGLLVDRAA